jgi:hypothetical protein
MKVNNLIKCTPLKIDKRTYSFEEKMSKIMLLFLTDFFRQNTINYDPTKNKYKDELEKLMYEIKSVPKELSDSVHQLEIKMPKYKGSLSELVNIADKLNFCIVPYQFCQDNIDEAEGVENKKEIRKGLNDFIKHNKYSYVICPLDYLNVYNILSDNDIPYYMPNGATQLSTFLNLNIPLMKLFLDKLIDHEKRIIKLEQATDNIKQQINNINSSVKKEAEQLRNTSLHHLSVEELMKMGYSENAAKIIDPLIFSTDKRIEKFTDDMNVTLGFAWGADIPKEVIDFLGIEKKSSQKLGKDNYYI